MHKRLFSAMLFTLFAMMEISLLPVIAQEVPPPPKMPARIDLKDGDTFVFLGDSITHQRLYTQYVEDFFYTRFPDRRIRFHNAGVGGARAWDALARVHRDVLNYQPRYVSILLGMNDGSYQPFHPEVFATYRRDMTALVQEIRHGGAVPILMSPTMFDSRAARLKNNPARPRSEEMLSEYNSVLAYYGRWLQDVAIENGMTYVDMFSLLNDLTVDARESDAAFTLIKDAVHPDAPGQLVMAYAMIEDLGLRGPLSNIRIQPGAGGNQKAFASGGKVENLTGTATSVAFDWTAGGLPWVVPEEALPGADLLRLGHRASKEGLEIHGLEPGQYELLIDEMVVATYTDTALSRHVELQDNQKTPQYQQALAVAMLNKQKNEGPVKELRDSWRTFQGWARNSRTLEGQPSDAKLAETVEKERMQLLSLEEKIKTAEEAARKIEDQIYSQNQPAKRHYVIRKIR